MTADFDLAIFEAGISMPGEMQRLANIIQPTVGILTNIGRAHDENFISAHQKTEEKCKLFKGCDIVITNGDDPALIKILSGQTKAELITWGNDEKNTIHIVSQQKKENTTHVNLQYQGRNKRAFYSFCR
jgi:alanine racemase